MVAVAKRKDIDTRFGRRLRELREAQNLTQTELADRADMNYQDVSRLERGVREPVWSTLLKLARALGVSISEFDTPDEQPPSPEPPAEEPAPRSRGKLK